MAAYRTVTREPSPSLMVSIGPGHFGTAASYDLAVTVQAARSKSVHAL